MPRQFTPPTKTANVSRQHLNCTFVYTEGSDALVDLQCQSMIKLTVPGADSETVPVVELIGETKARALVALLEECRVGCWNKRYPDVDAVAEPEPIPCAASTHHSTDSSTG